MSEPAHGPQIEPKLQAAVERLRAFAPVEQVILYGSRARGDSTVDSDWDLCVLLQDDIPPGAYTPLSMWRKLRDLGLTIQVVPMRKSVFERRRSDVNTLAHDVARDGVVIFERPRPRAG